MNYPNNFSSIHIELTDKCQASCPMCARNYNGGEARPFVGKNEISLEKFKQWINPSVLEKLDHFYACGNYGDPIIAQDCSEIMEYVRQHSNAKIGIHTNGSARTIQWWSNLAKVLKDNHEVVFGIDGFADSHVLYRRGTDWHKIIENAKSFINSGGIATIDCLVFKHNENELKDFEEQMLAIGFKSVNFKYTRRFYDMKKFPVWNKEGIVEYNLEPTTKPYEKINLFKIDDIKKDISILEKIASASNIKPKCKIKKEIYVDSLGNVTPCCWVGLDLIEEPLKINLSIHDLRNKLVENTKMNFNSFYKLNLNEYSLEDIIKDEIWEVTKDFRHKPWVCIKNCT